MPARGALFAVQAQRQRPANGDRLAQGEGVHLDNRTEQVVHCRQMGGRTQECAATVRYQLREHAQRPLLVRTTYGSPSLAFASPIFISTAWVWPPMARNFFMLRWPLSVRSSCWNR